MLYTTGGKQNRNNNNLLRRLLLLQMNQSRAICFKWAIFQTFTLLLSWNNSLSGRFLDLTMLCAYTCMLPMYEKWSGHGIRSGTCEMFLNRCEISREHINTEKCIGKAFMTALWLTFHLFSMYMYMSMSTWRLNDSLSICLYPLLIRDNTNALFYMINNRVVPTHVCCIHNLIKINRYIH